MSKMQTVQDIRGDCVTADAGATWRDVLAATLPQRFTPPVLTDYLGLSVGGTLAVGGVGAATSRHAERQRYRDGGRHRHWPRDHLFRQQQPLSVQCRPRRTWSGCDHYHSHPATRPSPQHVRRYVLFYPDLNTMLRDQRLLADDSRFDAVLGAIVASQEGRWLFRLDAMKQVPSSRAEDSALLSGLSDLPSKRQVSSLTYSEYVNRFAVLEAALRNTRQWFCRIHG
jgi:cytokinin dehydrogenase